MTRTGFYNVAYEMGFKVGERNHPSGKHAAACLVILDMIDYLAGVYGFDKETKHNAVERMKVGLSHGNTFTLTS